MAALAVKSSFTRAWEEGQKMMLERALETAHSIVV